MMAKTHLVMSWTAGITLLPSVTAGNYTPEQYAVIFIGLTVGSLLPDLDHPQSLLSQMIPIIGGVISNITRHRGILHSILAVVILFFVGGFVAGLSNNSMMLLWFWSAMIFAYIGHILADMMTKHGVQLLYPFKWRVGLKLMRTNGLGEFFFRWLFVFVSIYHILGVLLQVF